MNAFLIIVAIVFFLLQTLSLKKIKTDGIRENILVNGLFTGLIGLVLIIYTLITKLSISLPTVLLGIVFGILFIATVSVYYYAMQTGPLSYTTFFFSASMLIPSLAGIFFWKERPKASIIIALVLFLIAFYLISVLGGEKGKKGSAKWLLLCLLTFLLNGGLSVVCKIQQTILHGEEVTSFTAVSFCFAFFAAILFYGILLLKTGESRAVALQHDRLSVKASVLGLVGASVGTGVSNFIMNYLVSRVPSAYLFPLVQGSLMVAVTLFSVFVLKEKMSKAGICGIAIGLAAIVIINL